jgi:predicted kinase
MKKLIIMRGLPGSGKSTLANVVAEHHNGVAISTDDYFMCGSRYLFDGKQLGEAHTWNRNRCERLMKAGVEMIVVDNTNIQLWEMKPYVELAMAHGYDVAFNESFGATVEECAKRNTHGVPLEAIERMAHRLEKLPNTSNADNVVAILASTSPFEKSRRTVQIASTPNCT